MTLSLQAPSPLTMPGQFVLPATAATRAQVSIVPFTTTTTTNSMWCYWHLPQLTILTATTQLNRRALKESVSTSTRWFHCGNFNYKSSPRSAGRYRKENVTHSHCFIYSHSQHEHIEHFVHLRVHCSALLICCCCHWLATLLWGCFLCHHVFAVSLLTVRRRRGQCVIRVTPMKRKGSVVLAAVWCHVCQQQQGQCHLNALPTQCQTERRQVALRKLFLVVFCKQNHFQEIEIGHFFSFLIFKVTLELANFFHFFQIKFT